MPRKQKQSDSAHPTDVAVGAKVRAQRLACGMSQTKLAQTVGVSFQQIQKYEKGHNRISASRLEAIAEALDLPVSHFFGKEIGRGTAKGFDSLSSFLSTGRAIRLMRAFSQIKNTPVENLIVNFVETIARSQK